MSQFPIQLGATYTEVEAQPTLDRDGERTVVVRPIYRHGKNGFSSETIHLDILTAAVLVSELKAAIDAHFVDSITPKAPSEVF